jgi:ATP-dependent exoDNAse (exonuclease V) beta subunit
MLGALRRKTPKGRLAYIIDNLGILKDGQINPEMDILNIMNESRVDELYATHHPSPITHQPAPEPFMLEPVYTEPLSYEPSLKWRDVTEDVDIKVKHGEDWVLLGKVFHRLFEELSKGLIGIDKIDKKACMLLRNELYNERHIERLTEIIKKDFEKLARSGYLEEVVFPLEDSYAELPFILQRGTTIFRGRVDRIVVKNTTAHIYDYKTFPIDEKELPGLIDTYRFQMDIYREAVERILSLKTKSYLLFTHMPLLIEI